MLPHSNIFPLIQPKDEYTSVQFNLVNTTPSAYSFDLFNLDITLFPDAGPTPYITSSHTGYNFFNQSILYSPIIVRRIMLVAQSAEQLNQAINMVTKDANGIQASWYELPNTVISANQYQPYIAYVDFEPSELILDTGTIISQYSVAAQSTVTMVLFYQQLKIAEYLTDRASPFRLSELSEYKPNNRTEQELLFQYMRPNLRPPWLKPVKIWTGFGKNLDEFDLDL